MGPNFNDCKLIYWVGKIFVCLFNNFFEALSLLIKVVPYLFLIGFITYF
jgi:hypothetical protein